MGNTPSNQHGNGHGSPRHADNSTPRSGRNPNLKVPIPPTNVNTISPSPSNPASPSGRAGSPRRRKSLELPDMNKLSFTPAAAVPTTATNTNHHLAPSSSRAGPSGGSASASTSSPPPKRWQQIIGGAKSPLSPNFGQMSKIDPATISSPVKIPTSNATASPTRPSAGTPTQPTQQATVPPPAQGEGMDVDKDDGSVSVQVQWTGSGKVVHLVGDFADNWKARIPMVKGDNGFTTTLRLKPGQYRLKFIVDDSWRCSKDIPTATDEDGTFVNWLEVEAVKTEEEAKAAWSMDAESPARPDDDEDSEWTTEIPDPVILYQYIEELENTFDDDREYKAYVQQNYITPVPAPPWLPRILERVIVNNDSVSHYDQPRWDHASPAGLDDNSILAVPNHVVLNHLTASAIKNGTLGVGTTTRYRKKYITTMFFKPTPADLREGEATDTDMTLRTESTYVDNTPSSRSVQ